MDYLNYKYYTSVYENIQQFFPVYVLNCNSYFIDYLLKRKHEC